MGGKKQATPARTFNYSLRGRVSRVVGLRVTLSRRYNRLLIQYARSGRIGNLVGCPGVLAEIEVQKKRNGNLMRTIKRYIGSCVVVFPYEGSLRLEILVDEYRAILPAYEISICTGSIKIAPICLVSRALGWRYPSTGNI